MSAASDRVVPLGEIAGVYGVKGWVKVRSYTEPRTNLLDFPCWQLDKDGSRVEIRVEAAKASGRSLIAKLEGIDDRDRAFALIGAGIGVRRSELPALDPGEYYWADLEGLGVVSLDGDRLGTVRGLLATGANDVLVLEGERLIPFLVGPVVRSVDLEGGEIVVDWDASYWE